MGDRRQGRVIPQKRRVTQGHTLWGACLFDLADQEHVGGFLAHLEVIAHFFVQDNGCKWAEGFAEFNFQVQEALHFG